MIYFEVYILLD